MSEEKRLSHDEMSALIAAFTPSSTPENRISDAPPSAILPNSMARRTIDAIEKFAISSRQTKTVEKDGILHCAVCGSPLQAWVKGPVDQNGVRNPRLMPIRCECDKEQERQYNEQKMQQDFERELMELRSDIGMCGCRNTFADDDKRLSKISYVCNKYVEQWEKMRDENTGIIFYGDIGLGKSFYSECIVNALAEKRVLTGFTSAPELITRFQGTYDKEDILYAIERFQLLAIDDLGAERSTSFGAETMYNIVNTRYKSGKPTIITTNLDLEELKNDTDLWRRRIYDRILEMCAIALPLTGTSRRTELSEHKAESARRSMSKK